MPATPPRRLIALFAASALVASWSVAVAAPMRRYLRKSETLLRVETHNVGPARRAAVVLYARGAARYKRGARTLLRAFVVFGGRRYDLPMPGAEARGTYAMSCSRVLSMQLDGDRARELVVMTQHARGNPIGVNVNYVFHWQARHKRFALHKAAMRLIRHLPSEKAVRRALAVLAPPPPSAASKAAAVRRMLRPHEKILAPLWHIGRASVAMLTRSDKRGIFGFAVIADKRYDLPLPMRAHPMRLVSAVSGVFAQNVDHDARKELVLMAKFFTGRGSSGPVAQPVNIIFDWDPKRRRFVVLARLSKRVRGLGDERSLRRALHRLLPRGQ